MQCYQLTSSASSSTKENSFLVKNFDPASSNQRVPLSEVYQNESLKGSKVRQASLDSGCISIETEKSQRWAKVDMKLMHMDVKKFLKRNGVGNSKMAGESLSQKTHSRKVLSDLLKEEAEIDRATIENTLMQLVKPEK